jgi:hypothetical protein
MSNAAENLQLLVQNPSLLLSGYHLPPSPISPLSTPSLLSDERACYGDDEGAI